MYLRSTLLKSPSSVAIKGEKMFAFLPESAFGEQVMLCANVTRTGSQAKSCHMTDSKELEFTVKRGLSGCLEIFSDNFERLFGDFQ